jgi:hypothetical protein
MVVLVIAAHVGVEQPLQPPAEIAVFFGPDHDMEWFGIRQSPSTRMGTWTQACQGTDYTRSGRLDAAPTLQRAVQKRTLTPMLRPCAQK